MTRVLVVQRRMTHYRVPFFEALRSTLGANGVELRVAFGSSAEHEKLKEDEGILPWGCHLDNTYLFGASICWQPLHRIVGNSDMVIVGHENKLVNNLRLQLSLSRTRRVALWGHGANLQGNPTAWREAFKRLTARKADWWFGYTNMSRALIESTGFPGERVTIVDNAVDSIELGSQLREMTSSDLEGIRSRWGISSKNVGAYVGSLYATKRIEFLLNAARSIRQRVPDFEFIIAGNGPDQPIVRAFCQEHSWAKYLGVATGRRKAEIFAVSQVFLNPGGVGLGVLDAFVSGVPMITTDCGLHGPEVAYLNSGDNGIITLNNECSFVDAAERVLTDSAHRLKLVDGCSASASLYTVKNMAQKFSDGIMKCLAAPIYRWSL